jgi:hypothetical protein
VLVIVRIKWTPILGRKRRKVKLRPGSHIMLGVLLLAPALPVSTIADVPPKSIVRPVLKPVSTETLSSFMRRKNFAQPYNLTEIEQSASQASIPPSLIVCIEFVESSGGKHYDVETNNPLGWQNGKASFPSVRAAIRHVSQELGSGRWYAGKTLEEKLRVYNPRPYYSVKVLGCMSQLPQ